MMKIQIMLFCLIFAVVGCSSTSDRKPVFGWNSDFNPVIIPHSVTTPFSNSVMLQIGQDGSILLYNPGGDDFDDINNNFLKVESPEIGKSYGFTIADEGYKLEILDKDISEEKAISEYVEPDDEKTRHRLSSRKPDKKFLVFNIERL